MIEPIVWNYGLKIVDHRETSDLARKLYYEMFPNRRKQTYNLSRSKR